MITPGALLQRYRADADPLRTERRVELVAVVLVGVLLLQLLYTLLRLGMDSSPRPVAPTADALAVAGALERRLADAEGREDIRARPLFWPDRRPAAAAAVDPAADKAGARRGELEKVTLLGVFGSGAEAGVIALVKQSQRRVHVGEKVLGWQLAEVSGNRARFTEAGAEQWLQLRILHAGGTGEDSAATAEPPARNKKQSNAEGNKPATRKAASKRAAAAAAKPTPRTEDARQSPETLTLGGRGVVAE